MVQTSNLKMSSQKIIGRLLVRMVISCNPKSLSPTIMNTLKKKKTSHELPKRQIGLIKWRYLVDRALEKKRKASNPRP